MFKRLLVVGLLSLSFGSMVQAGKTDHKDAGWKRLAAALEGYAKDRQAKQKEESSSESKLHVLVGGDPIIAAVLVAAGQIKSGEKFLIVEDDGELTLGSVCEHGNIHTVKIPVGGAASKNDGKS